MDLEKLEKLAKDVSKRLEDYDNEGVDFKTYRTTMAKIKSLIAQSSRLFPDHQLFFESVTSELEKFDTIDMMEAIEYILKLLKLEKSSEAKIKGLKIFKSAEDKMKEVGLSFRINDYPSVLQNLNSILELVLKDKLGIPTTITSINTSNIVDILVKHKIEPYLYLVEAKKRVLLIANKTKHQSYTPSKIECINAIKIMEELISKLRNKEIKLTEEIRNKIFQGL